MKKIINYVCDSYLIFCIYGMIGWIYEVSWFLIVRQRFVNRGVLFGPILPIYGFGILILLLILKKFLSKKHCLNNIYYLLISSLTLTTLIYTTIVEYTTDKIYSVSYYLTHYGIYLLIINIFVFIISYLLIKKYSKFGTIDVTIVITFILIWIITTLIEYIAHYMIDTYFHKLLWDYSKDFLNINSRVNWDASRNFAIGGTILLCFVQPLIDKLLNNIKLNIKLIISLVIFIPMIIDLII